MKAKEGHKFVVSITDPVTGEKFIVGGKDGKMNPVPVAENGRITGEVIAWNDINDVERWLKAFREKNTKEQWAVFLAHNPEVGEVRVIQ